MTFRGTALAMLMRLFGILPLRLNQAAGSMLGRLFCLIPNRNLHLARRNIELCFPELGPGSQEQLVRQSIRASSQTLVELGWSWNRQRSEVLAFVRDIHGLDIFEQARASGAGILVAVPHLGAWEVMGQYLASRMDCAFMFKEPRDPGVARVITRGRMRAGAELIRADASGVRRIFRALRKGMVVGILPDQQPKAGQGQFAPFFGVEALTMVLFSKLAHKTGCPVLYGWAERLPAGAGFDLHFSAAAAAISDPDLRRSVAALNQGVEDCVRQCPAQYQWGYKRFGIRPDGEPPLY